MFSWHFNRSALPENVVEGAIADLEFRVRPTRPLAMIVFGSVADSTAREGSDLDVLLVYLSDEDIKSARQRIYDGLKGPLTALPVDLVFVTKADFERKRWIGGVCFEANLRGRRVIDEMGD